MLLGLDLARGEKRLLEALLKTYRHSETRLGELTCFVEKLYEESREAHLIRTIPGLGKYLAVLVAVEIADINRFADAPHLHAYAGVIHSTHSSVDMTYNWKSLRADRPQSNGICGSFHKTVLDEFYRVVLRKQFYTCVEELQKHLDEWLAQYNNQRTH